MLYQCYFIFFFFFFIFYIFFFFFFFQAEDGIRDRTVTGVQTCALPISIPFSLICFRIFSWRCSRCPPEESSTPLYTRSRSEERRVGKECRSRWSREH